MIPAILYKKYFFSYRILLYPTVRYLNPLTSSTDAIVTQGVRALRKERIITIADNTKNTKEYVSRHERFVRTPTKSFFKELFLGDTVLARNLKKMSEQNGVIKGLKNQECGRGANAQRPPIAYVPVIDEVQDALNAKSTESRTKKIKLPNGTTFQAGIWYSGTPEEFLNHVKQAMHACERKELFSDYDEACSQVAESVRKYKKANDDHKSAKERKVPAAEIKSFKETRDGYYKAIAEHEQKRSNAAEGFFSLYANLLSVESRVAWDKIVSRQIRVTPWMDLKGKTQLEKRAKTQKSFDDCIKHHLLTVFADDAAEKQKFYISNVLKKPTRVTVRAYFTCVEQLNSYVELLPGLYTSLRATPATKIVEPFDEAELANILLRHCPTSWQDQYNLNQETIPQDSWKLLLVLENIEKLNPGSMVPNKSPANNNNNGGAKANAKSEPTGKRKGTDSSSGRIPRKKRTKKHCVLCKEKGGKHDTYNTNDCAKWEKDGSLKSAWVEKGKSNDKKSDGRS
jgi:hypothetical protein